MDRHLNDPVLHIYEKPHTKYNGITKNFPKNVKHNGEINFI